MGIYIDDMDLVRMAIGIFWTLLFLQSGFDKLLDWNGNIDWLKGHFEKSRLGGMVLPMVAILALVEIIAGLLCAAGIVQILLSGKTYGLAIGMLASLVSLLMLFFGQRLAKDYEGAKTIAIYFGVALISIMLIK